MGKNQGFLSVNLSKARDNSPWAVSRLAELTVTPLSSPSFPLSPVCPSQKPPCVDSERPRVYRHHARMWSPFTTLAVSDRISNVQKSRRSEERSTAVLFGSVLALNVYAPDSAKDFEEDEKFTGEMT